MRDLVIADQQAVRLAARRSEFFFVDLAEQVASIELDRALQVAAYLDPPDIEDPHLYPRVASRGPDEPREAAPRCFQRLEPRMMDDRVDLLGHQLVDRRDQPVDLQFERGVRQHHGRLQFAG